MEINFFYLLVIFTFTTSVFTHSLIIEQHDNINGACSSNVAEDKTESVNNGNKNVELVVISTIDGIVTAVDFKNGKICWKTHVNSLGLISSSLENLHVLDKGLNIRLVPSLDGRLFKYDDGNLEPLPITAESMLKNSAKVGDNLSIIGEREKIVYGLNYMTGEAYYKCTSKGCVHFMDVEENETILVVEQVGHIVHAVNSQKGVSQWNFRVAEFQLTLVSQATQNFKKSANRDSKKYALLTERNSEEEQLLSALKIAMNGGYIGYFNDSSNTFDWVLKLSHPIVDVWYLKDNKIIALDQFDEMHRFFLPTDKDRKFIASLFVGSFKNQLFIKQSKKFKLKTNLRMQSNKYQYSFISAVSTLLPLGENTQDEQCHKEDKSIIPFNEVDAIPKFESGMYYIVNYAAISNETHCILNVSFYDLNPFKKWISVIVGTVILTLACTFVIYQLFIKPRTNLINREILPDNVGEVDTNIKSDSKAEKTNIVLEPEYLSRFLQDFTVIKVLGRGGFGLVIEAKNNIDDCCYAVKRIPYYENKAGKNMFTRVNREVKALAMLDHPGIVRYFNAWTEVPPEEWQKVQDRQYRVDSHLQPFTSTITLSSSNHPTVDHLKNALNRNPLQLFDIQDNSHLSTSSEDENLSSTSQDLSGISPVAYLYIQMQLCRKDTLRDWLTKNSCVRKQDDMLKMFKQIVIAVDYVHQKDLMHRDLKPSNIFFSLNGNIKIGDFGLAATTTALIEEDSVTASESSSNMRTKHVGTYLYMSPEQRFKENYDNKTDIFALGIIFFELLYPFQSAMERIKVIKKVRDLKFPKEFVRNFTSEHKLLQKMLQSNPQDRPSADIIRNHKLFS